MVWIGSVMHTKSKCKTLHMLLLSSEMFQEPIHAEAHALRVRESPKVVEKQHTLKIGNPQKNKNGCLEKSRSFCQDKNALQAIYQSNSATILPHHQCYTIHNGFSSLLRHVFSLLHSLSLASYIPESKATTHSIFC